METPTHVVQGLQGEAERLTQYLQTLALDAWPCIWGSQKPNCECVPPFTHLVTQPVEGLSL